jgi:hypothetical protein
VVVALEDLCRPAGAPSVFLTLATACAVGYPLDAPPALDLEISFDVLPPDTLLFFSRDWNVDVFAAQWLSLPITLAYRCVLLTEVAG